MRERRTKDCQATQERSIVLWRREDEHIEQTAHQLHLARKPLVTDHNVHYHAQRLAVQLQIHNATDHVKHGYRDMFADEFESTALKLMFVCLIK